MRADGLLDFPSPDASTDDADDRDMCRALPWAQTLELNVSHELCPVSTVAIPSYR